MGSEVYVTMSADGVPRDAFRTRVEAERQIASMSGGTRYDRIERYVLPTAPVPAAEPERAADYERLCDAVFGAAMQLGIPDGGHVLAVVERIVEHGKALTAAASGEVATLKRVLRRLGEISAASRAERGMLAMALGTIDGMLAEARARSAAPAYRSPADQRARVLLGNILFALESVGASLDGEHDADLGPVVHAPAAIRDLARQRDDYATALQVESAKGSEVENVVLAVARAIGLDHEPPGSLDELLAECRKMRCEPAASGEVAEVEAEAAALRANTAEAVDVLATATRYSGDRGLHALVVVAQSAVAKLQKTEADLAREREAHEETRRKLDEAGKVLGEVIAIGCVDTSVGELPTHVTPHAATSVMLDTMHERDAARAEVERLKAEVASAVTAPCDACGHGKSADWKALEAEVERLRAAGRAEERRRMRAAVEQMMADAVHEAADARQQCVDHGETRIRLDDRARASGRIDTCETVLEMLDGRHVGAELEE